MIDLLLVFPPQWSPFQPPLSLPSLSAWLKRAQFQVRSLDLNLTFYDWLLSSECAELLIREVDESDLSNSLKIAYRSIFLNSYDFRKNLQGIRELKTSHAGTNAIDSANYLKQHYLAVKSFENYLAAVSEVSKEFAISPYEFRLKSGNLQASMLEQTVKSPPSSVIKRFIDIAVLKHILAMKPMMIGISCIGQEQLYFTLLLGAALKELSDIPIIVGGTILSRIFERGVLKTSWFHRFFDVIVRNEGEKPCDLLLSNFASGRLLTENVPGIVYCEKDKIVSSAPCSSLKASELPYPDFDDIPLERYLSAGVTLPILSSRGCYWGKCEFCHHGMVYGDKYGPYEARRVLETVEFLAKKYKVNHFAFNDEAIPPKTIRSIGMIFPPNKETGWNFTGLIKFENFFKQEDFISLYSIGFRSLYVGLESASERVLKLMKKHNKRETIIRNLTDATAAGIWMHCFLFFGFPGETDSDAQQTYDFVLSNSEIIDSFGCGIFSLEHNAPIFHHVEDFGVQLKTGKNNDIAVYYDYEVAEGITLHQARHWMKVLTEASLQVPKYHAAGWVPREHLLCLLSVMTPERLIELSLNIRNFGGLPREAKLQEFLSFVPHPTEEGCWIAVNRLNRRVLSLKGNSAALVQLFYENAIDLQCISKHYPAIIDRLAFSNEILPS